MLDGWNSKMYEWHRLIQIVVNEIDERIKRNDDDALTLQSLSKKLGYSEFHTTRRFSELSGMLLKDYIRLRKLAFALIEVRDTKSGFLDIAVKYGFGSHEAFTRAFRKAYGITPRDFRKNPLPVVLRTKITTFDRYILGNRRNWNGKINGRSKSLFYHNAGSQVSAHKKL